MQKDTLMFDISMLVEDSRYFRNSRRTGTIPEPNSCALCGAHGPNEGMYIAGSVGLHTWVEPSDKLRLLRMKARRAENN